MSNPKIKVTHNKRAKDALKGNKNLDLNEYEPFIKEF